MREERVYFITGGGATKIGRTVRHPLERLEELQASSPVPLRLVYDHPGGAALERALHRAFESIRRHGSEWFQEELSYNEIRAEVAKVERWLGRPEKLCVCGCGSLFRPLNPSHKYATSGCELSARKRKRKKVYTLVCAECERSFKTDRKPTGRKFCSALCRETNEVKRGDRKYVSEDRVCARPACENQFRAGDPRRIYCSYACRKLRLKEVAHEAEAPGDDHPRS